MSRTRSTPTAAATVAARSGRPSPTRWPHRRVTTPRPARRRVDLRGREVCVCAAAAVVVLLTTCGCAQRPPSVSLAASVSTQQCVQDVFTVLSAMIDKPYDDQPFADFVSRYGTTSPAYTAYRDSFTAFYSEAVAHGVSTAEKNLLAGVTKDCTGPTS
jgi:hypothetical protein